MGLNVYGDLTQDHEKKITARLQRAGLLVDGYSWADSIGYHAFSHNTDEYRRSLFIFCRVVGMKPTMRASWGWGHYGTHAE